MTRRNTHKLTSDRAAYRSMAMLVLATWVGVGIYAGLEAFYPQKTQTVFSAITHKIDDSALYTRIFDAQKQARWDDADAVIAQLNNKILLGHVLAARYQSPQYKASYAELADWLSHYGDHPEAKKIYVMARMKHPSGEPLPNKPQQEQARVRSYDDGLATVIRTGGFSGWQSGLEAYKNGNYGTAANQFTRVLDQNLTPADRSAAAFWAWRAYKADGNTAMAAKYLAVAAEEPRCFYGILARKASNQELDIPRDALALNGLQRRSLLETPALARAEALVKIGESALAEKEVEAAFAAAQDGDILKLAGEWNLASLQMRLGGSLNEGDGARDMALYPTPDLNGEKSYAVDPALVFAITRQESKFNEKATSNAGARGLMQLMPATAHSMAERSNLGFTTAELRHELYEPETNVQLGQKYIRYLMNEGAVGKNLVFIIAAYNAGPGNLHSWKESLNYHDDPLLFIEMIPSSQTRNYVVNVMANYWIYSSLLGKSYNGSAVALLERQWPKYRSDRMEVAELQ